MTALAAPVPGSGAGVGLGLLSTYSTESFALTDHMGAAVNLATGNLVLRSTDRSVSAPGLSLNVDRFYNSKATGAGAYGARSVMSTGRDVGLTITSSKVTFYGPSGFAAAFTSDGSGGWTEPAGINADLVKKADGTWTLTYQQSGEKLTFSTGGFLTSDADRNGNTITPLYNSDGAIASLTDTAGRVTTFDYNNGRLTRMTDSAGRVTDYGYDSGTGELTSAASLDGQVVYTYVSGKLTRISTGDSRLIDFGYDTSGRTTTVTRYLVASSTTGGAATTTFAYPSATSTTQTNPNGKTTTYTLNSTGRVTSVSDPLGHTRSVTYTPNGDVATAVDAMGTGTGTGNTVKYTYDSANNPTSASLPTGAVSRAYYAAQTGKCTSTDTSHPYQAKCLTGTDGSTSTVAYDAPGNVTATATTTTGGGSVSKTFTHQGVAGATCGGHPGQVCSATDGNGHTTTFAYDTSGNLTTSTPPAVTGGTPLGATTTSYDSVGRALSVTDGKGQVTSYAYDSADRVTQVTYSPGGDSVQYVYDHDGNLTNQQDNRVGGKSYIYDGAGRQTGTSLPNGPTVSVTLDSAGNTLTYTDPSGTVTYGYDAANELTSLAEPGGTCPTTGTGTKCTRFGYNANGARTSVTYPGGTTQTATVDNSGRPTRLQATAGSSTLSDLAYTYTAATAGTAENTDRTSVQSRTETVSIAGRAAGTTQRYSYDTLARITNVGEYPTTTSTTPAASWAYAYDNTGNRTSASVVTSTGGAATTTTWGYNQADELTSRNGSATGWAYDANGNETSSPGTPAVGIPARSDALNVRDQVTSIATSGTGATTLNFGYFGTSNTDRASAGGTTFVNALLGISSATTSGATTAYTRTPDGALVSERLADGTSRYYLTDTLGSVIGLVNATGAKTAAYSYDPYGQARTTSGTDSAGNPWRYTGGYLDTATGLYKLGYRYYDPSTGRFTQPDPTGQEANDFLYAAADPLDYSDPFGAAAGISVCALGICKIRDKAKELGHQAVSGLETAAKGCATGVGIRKGYSMLPEAPGSALRAGGLQASCATGAAGAILRKVTGS